MTTGAVVDHDPTTLTYVLPPERAAWLTRAANPANSTSPSKVWRHG